MRSLFKLWLPLAVSFEMMMLEAPTIQAAVGRLPDPKLHLAAWGLTISLSLLIESPVIMLLSTAITLSKDSQAFHQLRNFMLRLIGWCTFLAAAVAFTPLYDVVTLQIMRLPANIADAARSPLQIMLLWTAFIGWRRFYQGVMVRFGHTRAVSLGTSVRLVAAVATAVVLVRLGTLTGGQVAACVLMAAVVAEAVAATLLALPILRSHLEPPEHDTKPLTDAEIRTYHVPLAFTTLLTLLSHPMSAAAAARLPNPHESLAAVPVASIILLLLRGPGLAVQEIAVAKAGDATQRAQLWRFAWAVGLVCSAGAATMLIPAVLAAYLSAVQVPVSLHAQVQVGVVVGLLQPLITALGACARGNLMALHRSKVVYRGMVVQLAVQGLFLAVAIPLKWPGMASALGSITLATLVELVYLNVELNREA